MDIERAPGDSAGDRRPVGSDDRDANGLADGSREPRLDPRGDGWEPDPLSLGADGPGYAPVPLGGSEGEDLDDVRAPAPERPPVPTTANVRASMRPRRKDPWRRPGKDSEPERRGRTSSPAMRPPSIAARVVTASAVVAAVAGVLFVTEPIDLGGSDAGGGQGGKDLSTERVARLEAALRRESGQRYAWEMWAREFDPGRYRAVKRRAARRAERRDKATDGS